MNTQKAGNTLALCFLLLGLTFYLYNKINKPKLPELGSCYYSLSIDKPYIVLAKTEDRRNSRIIVGWFSHDLLESKKPLVYLVVKHPLYEYKEDLRLKYSADCAADEMLYTPRSVEKLKKYALHPKIEFWEGLLK